MLAVIVCSLFNMILLAGLIGGMAVCCVQARHSIAAALAYARLPILPGEWRDWPQLASARGADAKWDRDAVTEA